MQHEIDTNRQNFDRVLKKCFQEPPSAYCLASVSLQQAIRYDKKRGIVNTSHEHFELNFFFCYDYFQCVTNEAEGWSFDVRVRCWIVLSYSSVDNGRRYKSSTDEKVAGRLRWKIGTGNLNLNRFNDILLKKYINIKVILKLTIKAYKFRIAFKV